MRKAVPVSRGKYTAWVDEIDWERVMQDTWHIKRGYVYRNVALGKRKYRSQSLHEFVLGVKSGYLIDHIDQNPLNNVRANLRHVTPTQSTTNRGCTFGGVSKYKGVAWHGQCGKWRAQIVINRRSIHLGLFTSEEDAARAYDMASWKYHGEFGYRNFSGNKAPREVRLGEVIGALFAVEDDPI